jgi:nitrogen fixation-related uncharacterized protein
MEQLATIPHLLHPAAVFLGGLVVGWFLWG